MFALGEPRAAENLLRAAGFFDVSSEAVALPARFPSLDAAITMMREGFPPLRALMGQISEAYQQQAWEHIRTALAQFDTDSGIHLKGEILVVSGTR